MLNLLLDPFIEVIRRGRRVRISERVSPSTNDPIQQIQGLHITLPVRETVLRTQHTRNRVIRGWGNSSAYSNATTTTNDLDERIEQKIKNFRSWYRRKLSDAASPAF